MQEVFVKHIVFGIFIATCCLFSAEASASAHKAGFVLLREGVGARAAAMGEAQTAVVGEQTAAFWNPAGVAAMQGKHFILGASPIVSGNQAGVWRLGLWQ